MRSRCLVLLLVAATLSACGKSTECKSTDSPKACDCPGGMTGTQRCTEERWAPCDCPAPAAPPAEGRRGVPGEFCRVNCLGVFNTCKNASPDPASCETERNDCVAKCPP